jgi:hypothetical protein
VQLGLFSQIKDVLPPHQAVVDVVADLLGVSQDSAYRRMRAEKPLSLEEALQLTTHFKLSLDALAGALGQTVTFTYNRVQTAADFTAYLERMATMLGAMRGTFQAGGRANMLYGANEVAIFHSLGQPEYAAFKMFYWQQAVLNLPELAGKKFSPELVSTQDLALGRQIYDQYYAVPSTEIWTAEASVTAVRQLTYYHEAGLFASPALAKQVIAQFIAALENVAHMAENDSKDPAGKVPFQLYESDILIGNNTVLAHVNDTRIAYVAYHTFNAMTTLNPDFCAETEAFLRGLIRKSTLISGVAERQRRQFFAKLLAPVEALQANMRG